MSSALASLKKAVGGGSEDGTEEVNLGIPTRLEQNFSNMVDKIIARQRLGFCKSQVRNQATMEARDALRKGALPRLNSLDETQFNELTSALETRHGMRSPAQVASIVECLRIMRTLDEFAIPVGIMGEIAQHMRYDVYRMRDRLIMEGDEMKGLFKLCIAGIMQTDIDEYKNAVYLETGEFFCEEHLRPHLRNNPEPLVMMVAKHNTHIVSFTPEHYNQFIKPSLERAHRWKQSYLAEHPMFQGYSNAKLSALSSVAQVATFRAGEAVVEQGRTQLSRYQDHHHGIFFMLSGQAAAFKQVEPLKAEKKKDLFMERLKEEAIKKSKEDAVRQQRRESVMSEAQSDASAREKELRKCAAGHSTRHAEAALRRLSMEQAKTEQSAQKGMGRRASIETRTMEMNQPAAAPPPPPREGPSNRMGGPGQLYENMLMPLDDIAFGPDFKLASVSMAADELRRFLGENMQGLVTTRGVSKAVVMCDNPEDHEGSSHPRIFIKGATAEVDLTLRHLQTLGLNTSGLSEVHPYAPAELVMPVMMEHRSKVLSIIHDAAQDTHTEICPNDVHSRMTAIKIVGREGDCQKAWNLIQSQLDKKMWTVESCTLRPGQTFGEAAYMEGQHPMMDSKMHKRAGLSDTETSQWKSTSVVCLTQVECLVISVNDFGDMISFNTHQMVLDSVGNYPTDDAIRQTLTQYKSWDKYKTVLTAEIRDYNADRNNFGLPHHMPILEDKVHGHHYLHMYVERDGPDNKPKKKPHRVKRTALLPPKIGADHFSRK